METLTEKKNKTIRAKLKEAGYLILAFCMALIILFAVLIIGSILMYDPPHEISYQDERVIVVTYRVKDPLLGNAVYYYLTNSSIDPDLEIKWKYVLPIGEKLTLHWEIKLYSDSYIFNSTKIQLIEWTRGWE